MFARVCVCVGRYVQDDLMQSVRPAFDELVRLEREDRMQPIFGPAVQDMGDSGASTGEDDVKQLLSRVDFWTEHDEQCGDGGAKDKDEEDESGDELDEDNSSFSAMSLTMDWRAQHILVKFLVAQIALCMVKEHVEGKKGGKKSSTSAVPRLLSKEQAQLLASNLSQIVRALSACPYRCANEGRESFVRVYFTCYNWDVSELRMLLDVDHEVCVFFFLWFEPA